MGDTAVRKKSGKLSSSKHRRRKRRESHRQNLLRLHEESEGADSANTDRSPLVRFLESSKRPRIDGSEPRTRTGFVETGNQKSGSANLKPGVEGDETRGRAEPAPVKGTIKVKDSRGGATKTKKETAKEPPRSGSRTDQQKPPTDTNQRLE